MSSVTDVPDVTLDGGLDVLVLGGCGVDTVVYVPRLPLPFADSYLVPPIVMRAGQTGDGVALGLHALGLRVSLMDTVGSDHEGDLVRALHHDRGVPFIAVPTVAGTKRAVNLVDSAGVRLSLYDGTRSLDSDRFPEAMVAQLASVAQHAHVSITSPCQYSLDTLMAAGVSISTDLHDWNGTNPYHEAFARAADIVFLSTAALADPERSMHAIIANGRAHTVVATAGERGGLLLHRADGVVRPFPAAPLPAPGVDSNGAGDAFICGFLFGFLAGEPSAACVRYATIAGAHACTVASTEVDPIDRATLVSRSMAMPPLDI